MLSTSIVLLCKILAEASGRSRFDAGPNCGNSIGGTTNRESRG